MPFTLCVVYVPFSIGQYIPLSNDNSNTLQPLSNAQSKISSSLPDLTNTNFYCGLDRPIDEDKPLENDDYLSNPGQKTHNQFYGQPQPKGYITSCLSEISAPISSTGNAYSNIHNSTQSSSTINSLNVMSSLPGGTSSIVQAPTNASGVPSSQLFSDANQPLNNVNSKDLLSSSSPSAVLSTALGKSQPTTEPVTLILPSATNNTLSNRYAGTLFETKKATPPPPSYTEHMRQTAVLQYKMASISMCNNDGETLMRSHSDENLAAQKGGSLQQNPFMGNMMSASSVPSIYVEPNEQALFDYGLPVRHSPPDSPSESTTASYASSPPHMRPTFDQSIPFHDAYYDWPLGGSDKLTTDRSSLSHHKSLTELSMIAEEPHLQKPSLSHQLSLPSISIDNGKPMDQDIPGLNPFTMDDNELGFEADFSVLDNTQLPDLTSAY